MGPLSLTRARPRRLIALMLAALLLVAVLAGCGQPAAPSTTAEPTVPYTPPPPPTTVQTPLPPIKMGIIPGTSAAPTGAGVSFIADLNVPPAALPAGVSWEWDFGDDTGKVVLSGGVNNTQWHPYTRNGRYAVSVVLRDGKQSVLASATTSITVDDTPFLKECRTVEVTFVVDTLYRSEGNDPPNTYSWDAYEDWAGIRLDNLVWDGNEFSASGSETLSDGSQRRYTVSGSITTKPEGIELVILNWRTRYTSLVTEGTRLFTLKAMPLVKGGYTANVRGEFYASAVGSQVPLYVSQPFYDWLQFVPSPVTHKEFMGFDMAKYQPKIEVRFRE